MTLGAFSAHERAACPPVALSRSLARLSVHDMADSSGELVAVGIMEYHSRGGGPRLIQEWARGARVSASNTRVDGTCGQAGLVSARPYRHHAADGGPSETTPRRPFCMTKTKATLHRISREGARASKQLIRRMAVKSRCPASRRSIGYLFYGAYFDHRTPEHTLKRASTHRPLHACQQSRCRPALFHSC